MAVIPKVIVLPCQGNELVAHMKDFTVSASSFAADSLDLEMHRTSICPEVATPD